MLKTKEGSTARLCQLCVAYFLLYVLTGIIVKYFTGSPEAGYPGMRQFAFLVYNTFGAMTIPTGFVLLAGWYRMQTTKRVSVLGLNVPVELLYIIPSGLFTAVVIPTTTIMYSLPISVMVAMIIMRGSVIIISRAVDAVQIKQGLLKKKVYWEENVAVAFSLIAILIPVIFEGKGGCDFLHNGVALTTIVAYIIAYSIRLYIMNYYKNTAGAGVKRDNKAFFAIEQMSAYVAMMIIGVLAIFSPVWFGATAKQLVEMHQAVIAPHPVWHWAMISGIAFGMVSFFSVFIFMYKGRTATFAGLVNRLTSLIAGTVATLFVWLLMGGKFPKPQDWVSLALMFVAIFFLSLSELKRTKELAATRELDEVANDVVVKESIPCKTSCCCGGR